MRRCMHCGSAIEFKGSDWWHVAGWGSYYLYCDWRAGADQGPTADVEIPQERIV